MAKQEKPLTKSELLGKIATDAEITKKQAAAVLDSLEGAIKSSVGKTGPGKFVLPGLLKVEKKHVDAKPAKKGVPNPFKPGEKMDVKAKPAHDKIIVKPLGGLKNLLSGKK